MVLDMCYIVLFNVIMLSYDICVMKFSHGALAPQAVASCISPGDHGSTFAGTRVQYGARCKMVQYHRSTILQHTVHLS